MKRLLIFILLFVALNSEAVTNEFAPGTNAMILTVYDSFDVGPAGNGHFCWDIAALMLINPTNMYRSRYAGQSGQSNLGFLTNNLPAVGIPLVGAMHGTNTVFVWLGTSGNGGQIGNSNYYYTNINGEIEFPFYSYTTNGIRTNDWPFTTNNIYTRVFGDSTYLGNTNDNLSAAAFYSNVASNTAALDGVPFVNSVYHTLWEGAVFATNFTTASNLFYPVNQPPDFIQASHPQKTAMQGSRHIDDLREMGFDTNVWSCYVNWASSTVTASNNLSAGTVTTTTNSIAFPIRLRRLGPPVEIPDGFHTNDMRPTFAFVPSCSNAFNELLVITNVPRGTWVSYVGNTPVFTNVLTVTGTVSNNYYHEYQSPWYWQKMAVLNSTRKVRDINTNDASSISGQTYMRNFGSIAGLAWPTNAGVSNYVLYMLPQETTMEAVDIEGFNAAQPSTVTFMLSNAIPYGSVFANTLRAGTVHFGP